MNVGLIPDYWTQDEELETWSCGKHETTFYDYCIFCKTFPDDVFYVNVYEVGRGYGGPEEGGWWFDYGRPATIRDTDRPVSFRLTSFEEAMSLREFLQERYPDTGKSSSVIGGEDYRVAIEPHPPEAYPKERPHYE